MTKNRVVAQSLVALAALASIGGGASLAMIASAQTPAPSTSSEQATNQTAPKGPWHTDIMGGPETRGKGRGVMGTVSAVSGNTVTITNKDGTSYTVDATSAKISKIVDISVGDIKVGDTIGVQGTVSGASVTAVHIMDGVPPKPQAPPTTTQ